MAERVALFHDTLQSVGACRLGGLASQCISDGGPLAMANFTDVLGYFFDRLEHPHGLRVEHDTDNTLVVLINTTGAEQSDVEAICCMLSNTLAKILVPTCVHLSFRVQMVVWNHDITIDEGGFDS
jgi:hypothetical protein